MNRHTTPARLRETAASVLERHCGGCDRWLAFTAVEFHHSRASKSGLVGRCKACMCAAQVTRNHARKLGKTATYHAHSGDDVYWARYRVRNERRRNAQG